MCDISFSSNKLAKTFNSEAELYKKYGKRIGELIKRRMMVLMAAPSLAEVPNRPPERMHELKGEKRGTFAVDLKHPFRLVFKPNYNRVPRKVDGGIDLTKITLITILSVEDYH